MNNISVSQHYSISFPIQLKGIPFTFRDVHNSENPAPLNQYLLDDDCAYVLKRCYDGFTKEELTNDEEIMNNFFGSFEAGKAMLAKISDEVWEHMK